MFVRNRNYTRRSIPIPTPAFGEALTGAGKVSRF